MSVYVLKFVEAKKKQGVKNSHIAITISIAVTVTVTQRVFLV